MRFLCLTCEALARPVYYCAALTSHIVDVVLVERGLHHKPDDLRKILQQHVDSANSTVYDHILLVYGLCGKATAGLSATTIPLVIPRVHDCISLFLGKEEDMTPQYLPV